MGTFTIERRAVANPVDQHGLARRFQPTRQTGAAPAGWGLNMRIWNHGTNARSRWQRPPLAWSSQGKADLERNSSEMVAVGRPRELVGQRNEETGAAGRAVRRGREACGMPAMMLNRSLRLYSRLPAADAIPPACQRALRAKILTVRLRKGVGMTMERLGTVADDGGRGLLLGKEERNDLSEAGPALLARVAGKQAGPQGAHKTHRKGTKCSH